jgi:hypothetical protein
MRQRGSGSVTVIVQATETQVLRSRTSQGRAVRCGQRMAERTIYRGVSRHDLAPAAATAALSGLSPHESRRKKRLSRSATTTSWLCEWRGGPVLAARLARLALVVALIGASRPSLPARAFHTAAAVYLWGA